MSTYEGYQSRGSGARLFLILLLVAALGLMMLAVSNLGVILGTHAVEKHGQDALDVQKCLDDNGPEMVYKHKFDPTYYLLCQLDDGRWGLQAVAEDGHEKTAFVPKSGSWKDIQDYFGNWATKIKLKAYPWQ